MADTKIEWTDATWNPTTGCTRASSGCDNCYAFTMTKRLAAMGQTKYQGLIGKGHFNGVLKTHDDELNKPFCWHKPRMVFVNSMSDLFHADVPFEFVDKVFAVMATCPQHTFQVLTKRPERMAEYLRKHSASQRLAKAATKFQRAGLTQNQASTQPWPLPNVWLGTSVENQAAADERIPHLLRCPATVRFVSAEPLLGPVDFTLNGGKCDGSETGMVGGCGQVVRHNALSGWVVCGCCDEGCEPVGPTIDWVIVGGESGPKSRPCDVAWITSIARDCIEAGVHCFVKQLGANLVIPNDSFSEWPDEGSYLLYDAEGPGWNYQGENVRVRLKDKKGGDMNEWPEYLRVREWPRVEVPK
jgi:protein gp37